MDIDFRICLLGGVSCLAVYLPAMFGQNPAAAASSVPDWQTKAGGQMAFDVASVKPDAGRFARQTSRWILAMRFVRLEATSAPIFL